MMVLSIVGVIFMASCLPQVYPALCKPDATGTQPYPNDCSKYVYCMPNGMEMPMDCPRGFEWSQALNKCEWPECAGCSGQLRIPCPRLPPGVFYSTLSPPIDTTPVATTKETPTGLYCPRSFGLYAHPSDRSKFIQCSNSVPYVKDCPPGLHFNRQIEVCDYPAIADATY